MDTLTHTALGICLGEAIAGKQLGKKAMLIGALMNNLPDADVILQLFLSQGEGLLAHRGITHSIFTNLILMVLLARLCQHWFRQQQLSFGRSLLLCGSGLFLHIFLDALTSYGTGWFEPFNHARVSLNCLFILDPFLMLPLLICAIVLLALKRDSTRRQRWAKGALTIGLVYLAITFCIKIYVNRTVKEDLAAQHLRCDDFMASPAPLNNLLWYVATRNPDTCFVGYYSVFDAPGPIDYEAVAKNDSLLVPYRNSEEVRKLLRFSQGYYCLKREEDQLLFSDIRFGQLGGWYLRNTPFVFSFNISGHNDATHLQQARFKNFEPAVLSELWKRVKGEKPKR